MGWGEKEKGRGNYFTTLFKLLEGLSPPLSEAKIDQATISLVCKWLIMLSAWIRLNFGGSALPICNAIEVFDIPNGNL
jgi:uncharacterized RDD family membrane protein YckC